jgi:hypothetical protein
MGGHTSSIRYRQHSSWDHVTTQAPPLRQSLIYLVIIYIYITELLFVFVTLYSVHIYIHTI